MTLELHRILLFFVKVRGITKSSWFVLGSSWKFLERVPESGSVCEDGADVMVIVHSLSIG